MLFFPSRVALGTRKNQSCTDGLAISPGPATGGEDDVTCPGQRCQWQRKWVGDFDFPSHSKELGWSDLCLGLGPKQRGWAYCTSVFRLGGFPKAACNSTLPASAFNLAMTWGCREASLPAKRGN